MKYPVIFFLCFPLLSSTHHSFRFCRVPGLSMKTLGYSRDMLKICKWLDDEARRFSEDIEPYVDPKCDVRTSGGAFDQRADREAILSRLSASARSSFSRFVTYFVRGRSKTFQHSLRCILQILVRNLHAAEVRGGRSSMLLGYVKLFRNCAVPCGHLSPRRTPRWMHEMTTKSFARCGKKPSSRRTECGENAYPWNWKTTWPPVRRRFLLLRCCLFFQ